MSTTPDLGLDERLEELRALVLRRAGLTRIPPPGGGASRVPPPEVARAIVLLAGVKDSDIAPLVNRHRATVCRWLSGQRSPSADAVEAYWKALEVLLETVRELAPTDGLDLSDRNRRKAAHVLATWGLL